MPPRPFPFPLRVGTDICSIARIHKLIATKSSKPLNSRLTRFLPKLLTWPEQQFFWHRFQTYKEPERDLEKVAQFLAGRWAAKEACRKACEHLGLSNGFHSIIILPVAALPKLSPAATSRPQALILRERLSELPHKQPDSTTNHMIDFDVDAIDGQLCELSISHDTEWATAVALVPFVEAWQSQATINERHGDEG